MNTDQKVTNIMQTVRHCSDPEELRQMAKLLTSYSAYQEAQEAERRALDVERMYAEKASVSK